MRILIVEDEPMVAMALEDILTELGHTVAGTCARPREALECASKRDFDLAIVDVNLGGRPSFEIAKTLAARGVRLVFATGYDSDVLPSELAEHALLKKPYSMSQIRNTIDRPGP